VTTRTRSASALKRGLDIAGAAAGLVLGAPLLAGISLAVLASDGPPVLFRQERPGRGGRPFKILKFRTMRATRPGEVAYDTDAERTTRLGRFLRETSLDELPELWNVLRGDMSLVGPRPLLMEYLPSYTPEEARRHDVRPGVTGWAAVNGRHSRRFRERLALDTWYVDHWSLGLDLKILAMTAWQVLRRSDVAVTQGVDDVGFPLPRRRP
jgi:lipopolysaccharide/colanic/teichoic acid biosynthesis glycosyltransferase